MNQNEDPKYEIVVDYQVWLSDKFRFEITGLSSDCFGYIKAGYTDDDFFFLHEQSVRSPELSLSQLRQIRLALDGVITVMSQNESLLKQSSAKELLK